MTWVENQHCICKQKIKIQNNVKSNLVNTKVKILINRVNVLVEVLSLINSNIFRVVHFTRLLDIVEYLLARTSIFQKLLVRVSSKFLRIKLLKKQWNDALFHNSSTYNSVGFWYRWIEYKNIWSHKFDYLLSFTMVHFIHIKASCAFMVCIKYHAHKMWL